MFKTLIANLFNNLCSLHWSELQEALEVQCEVEYDCQCFWHFWLSSEVFTCAIGRCGATPFSASSAVCLTNNLQPEHFVPEPLASQEGIVAVDHVLFMDILSDRIKNTIFQCAPLQFFMRGTQMRHSFTHVLKTNPVSWNKKAARWAEVCTGSRIFFKYSLWPGLASDESLAGIYSLTSPWVASLPRSYHSHLLLANGVKCPVLLEGACQDIFWTCWTPVAATAKKNVLCKWFKGHRKVPERRICRDKSHLVFEVEPGSADGAKQDRWFPLDKSKGNVLIYFWGWKGHSWLDGESYSRTRSVSRHSAAAKRDHVPGWGKVKSLQWLQTFLSQNFRPVTSQAAGKQSKIWLFKGKYLLSSAQKTSLCVKDFSEEAFSAGVFNTDTGKGLKGKLHFWAGIHRQNNTSVHYSFFVG